MGWIILWIIYAVVMPLTMFLGLQYAKRRRDAHVRYIAEYRKSPESRILILND